MQRTVYLKATVVKVPTYVKGQWLASSASETVPGDARAVIQRSGEREVIRLRFDSTRLSRVQDNACSVDAGSKHAAFRRPPKEQPFDPQLLILVISAIAPRIHHGFVHD